MLPHKCPHPYHQKQTRRKIERNGLFAVLFLFILSFLAGRLSLKNVDDYLLENTQVRMELEQLKQENKLLLKQQDFIQNAQNIDLQAKQESRRSLTKLHDELSDIKEQLAFYQRVVAPETLVKGLYVHSFELQTLRTDRRYRYQLVLAQGVSNKKLLKGRYGLTIYGENKGLTQTLSLQDLVVESNPLIKYSFRYYQLMSDELELPVGFTPSRIKLTMTPSKRGADAILYEKPWAVLLGKP